MRLAFCSLLAALPAFCPVPFNPLQAGTTSVTVRLANLTGAVATHLPRLSQVQAVTGTAFQTIQDTTHAAGQELSPTRHQRSPSSRWINPSPSTRSQPLAPPHPAVLVKGRKGPPIPRGRCCTRTRGPSGSRGPIPGLAFVRRVLRWRLLPEGYSAHMDAQQLRDVIALAFRRWAEVAPLSFHEDAAAPATEADIQLAFGTGRHLGCPWAFDGPGGELAHVARPGEIHLDDDEPYSTSPSDLGVNLLQVTMHEIGHVLGLPHLSSPESVMHPQYPTTGGTMELSWQDRRAIQELYGWCEGSFDTVFDWVINPGRHQGAPEARFNTYFLRGDQHWLYDNSKGQPRPRDPRSLRQTWRGLPSGGVDGYLHIWTPEIDNVYFFKGTQYWHYDREAHHTLTYDPEGHRYPRRISEGFPGVSGPLDTAVFSHHGFLIYFFKGYQVWGYNVSSQQVQEGFPKLLQEVFPASIPSDHPTGNLDAAYYSHSHRTLFLIKGLFYWEVSSVSVNGKPSHNALLPRRRVAEQWKDLCGVNPLPVM